MSFKREKFLPNGGPDGGSGGKGGSVMLIADTNVHSLADFEHGRRFTAESGGHGQGSAKNGRAGSDVVLRVPCGTIVRDAETDEGLADLVEPGDRYVAAMGGRGGRGNRVFASSRRRAPRFSEKGEMGETQRIKLELRLIADIGLVGLPNAGKSSLLAALSNATPKIADYPFTTLSPNLGVMMTDSERVVLADIPGLIEGASDDKGLGLQFLRHIERTRLLIHVVDVTGGNVDKMLADFNIVRNEMAAYDERLSERPYIVVFNKIDELDDPSQIEEIAARAKSIVPSCIFVSALSGENIDALAERIIDFARDHPRPHSAVRLFAAAEVDDNDTVFARPKRQQVQIVSLPDGSFRILHQQVERAAERYDLSQPENAARFTKLLRKYRVEELLEAAGALPGAQVSIGRMDFDFYPDVFPEDDDAGDEDDE